ncbi:MAG: insulinase family protein [Acidobacteria bacterium]|nr:MAG: insulinase family protein [Acidobacteriota bacterium]
MKSARPVAAGIRTVNYPDIPEEILPNGLLVQTIEDHRFPIVSVQVAFPVGRVHNPDDNLSLLQLAVESVKEGTESRDARTIADQMDYWSIHYSGELFMESTLHAIRVLEQHLERGLEILSDLLLNPLFPEDELEKTRERWSSLLQAQRSQSDFLANERAYLSCFEGHPYSKSTISLEHLQQATRGRLLESYREKYAPDGALVLLAGDVTHEDSVRLARRFFGNWKSSSTARMEYSAASSRPKQILLVERPNSVQSRVLIAARALPVADPEMIDLRVANQILGGSASARLFLKLREEKGFTYGAYSRLKTYREDGLLMAGAGVRSDVTGQAIDEILLEFDRMVDGLPSDEELSRSQSEIIGAFIRQMETPSSIGALEIRRRLGGLPVDYYRNLPSAVQQVTPDMVRGISRRVFRGSEPVVIVVGDRKAVENQLKHLGEIELFDAQGKRLSTPQMKA